MTYESQAVLDLRSLARMLHEERRRIPRPTHPPQWLVDDCKAHSATAHQDAVDAKAFYDAASSGFLARCAEVGGDQAHEELDEAKRDLDGSREFLARCWDFCQHGLTGSWEELESGAFDAWIDAQNEQLADPDDQPEKREEQRRPEWKTKQAEPLVAVSQGRLF